MAPPTSTRTLPRRLVAAPVVLLLLLMAAVAAAPAQAARDLRASIKGIVLDAATGKGVPGTTVYVMGKWYPWGETVGTIPDWQPVAEAKTSKSGAYTVALPDAGTYRVVFVPADRTQYSMEAYPNAAVADLGDDVVVRYGRATSNISVKLDPSNRLEGHVWAAESRWDEFGEDDGEYTPLEGIPVQAVYQGSGIITGFIENPDSDPPGVPLGVDVTDEAGFYSIPGFKPFPFFVWANGDFFSARPADTTRRDRIVSDGTNLFPDGVKTLDTFLALTTEVNITGHVVDQVTGDPTAGLGIEVWETDETEQQPYWQPTCTVTTDANGDFGNTATASADDIACLNLVEPSALLRFPGNEQYYGEFFDDTGDQWGANQVRVSWGWTEDIGEWALIPTQQ